MNRNRCILSILFLMLQIFGSWSFSYASVSENSVLNINIQEVRLTRAAQRGSKTSYLKRNEDSEGNYKFIFLTENTCKNPVISLAGDKDTMILDVVPQPKPILSHYIIWEAVIPEARVQPDIKNYNIKFGESSGKNCKPLQQTILELQVRLEPNIEPDGSRILTITNISSQDLTIIEIEEDKLNDGEIEIKLDQEGLINKHIASNETVKITLKPKADCYSVASGKKKKKEYKFILGYKIDGESDEEAEKHKFEVYVFYNCENKKGSGQTETLIQLAQSNEAIHIDREKALEILESSLASFKNASDFIHKWEKAGELASKLNITNDSAYKILEAIEWLSKDIEIANDELKEGKFVTLDAISRRTDKLNQDLYFDELEFKKAHGYSILELSIEPLRKKVENLNRIKEEQQRFYAKLEERIEQRKKADILYSELERRIQQKKLKARQNN